MTDREKFEAWLDACPVRIDSRKNYANGWIDLTLVLPDEDLDATSTDAGEEWVKWALETLDVGGLK